jgi:hypothetical protein
MQTIKKSIIGCTLAGLFSVLTFAADDKPIKDDVKDAANATGRAAKKTGRKVKHGTKKVVNKAAEGTEKGANKVRQKTTP